jgi:hypothetical protein
VRPGMSWAEANEPPRFRGMARSFRLSEADKRAGHDMHLCSNGIEAELGHAG